ncbi:MAG TPA: hypothetical protein VFS36_05315 [Chitinophagaceae bacterium]|jgi:hypothetical protein|nr:hypothetical protein [Chitinophagaceae bacterium]
MKPFTLLALIISVFFVTACSSGDKKKISYCDNACLQDTLRFTGDDPGKPYVYISPKACSPDTLVWSNKYLVNNRKMDLAYLLGQPVTINAKYVDCYFKDTSYAWLQFNDCSTFRGFLLKLPYSKQYDISKYSSALTKFDPKFKIGDGLICYADYSFVYVEDMATGNKAQLKLADEELDIDFNNIHATFDSVNVTRTRIFVNLKQKGKITPLEKTISL